MSAVYPAHAYAGGSTSLSSSAGRSGMHKRRPPNSGSELLDPSENEALFASLPYNSYSLFASVVEILEGQPEERRWSRLHRGILALVKDYTYKAYFLRVFDIMNRKVLWSEKMYKGFMVTTYPHCVNLLTFESENGRIFGLNFANSTEASKFKGHIDKRNEQESRTHQQRAPEVVTPTMVPAATAPIGVSYGTRPTAMAPTFNANGVAVPSSALATPPPEKDSRNFLGFKKKKPKKENRKIRKEDISNPTNFEHRAHVGWDQDKGFKDIYSKDHIDESVADIIKAAGVSTEGMDRKTIRFVYDFIDSYKKGISTTAPPTVASIQNLAPPVASIAQRIQAAPLNNWPSSNTYQTMPNASTPPPPPRVASAQQSHGLTSTGPPGRPPPPPPMQGPRVIQTQQRSLPQLPPVNGTRPETGPPPPPPPPPVVAPIAAPPPPPPPPPSGLFTNGGVPQQSQLTADPLRGLPQPQANRGNLLAEIQAGKALKSVESSNANPSRTNTDARGNVMEQIRAGAQLRHIDVGAEQEKRKSTQGGQDLGGIAGALARALAERRDRLDSDTDSDESEENNEWSDS